jgi:hypothetical protein
MKKIVAGLFVATSLVALSACKPPATPNATDNAMATAPEAIADNNTVDAMANGTGNAMDSSGGEGNSAMAGNNATASNGTDPHGSNGGH